jgi:hypothetical protein
MTQQVDGVALPHADRNRGKLSVSLTGDARLAVEAIAQRQGVSEGEAVRRAVAVFKFLTEEMERGTVFRMQPPDGEPERFKIVFA